MYALQTIILQEFSTSVKCDFSYGPFLTHLTMFVSKLGLVGFNENGTKPSLRPKHALTFLKTIQN
jgi:hypothetical protein